MNNQKTLLISVLVTIVAIGLVETNGVQLNDPYLYAEPEKTPLILKKGNDVFVIQPGNKVIIDDQIMKYRSVDMKQEILIMKKTTVPFTDISAIDIPAGNKSEKYGLKGLLYGGLMGATVGVAMTMPEEEYHYMIFTVPICAGVDGAVLGIAGAGYGYTQKISEQSFELGSDEWRIANE
ncbi:MAG: hypothetical protein QF847_00200 [Candidatus Marinimicrobia bacterium]|nr:hypothetical protein [Candidatus Neomarinimicrobiota bacterium]MDP6725653.1 hypothetical protein [Candidatus Neomarinimicrobiota bacterium]|tara:strand:- start:655 stop:1191 length:537 start_codon:yes stop_codon:yes gene_type:complete